MTFAVSNAWLRLLCLCALGAGVEAYILNTPTDVVYTSCDALKGLSQCLIGMWDEVTGTCGCTGSSFQKPECLSTCGGCATQDITCTSLGPVAPSCTCTTPQTGCTSLDPPVVDVDDVIIGPALAVVSSVASFAPVMRATTHPCQNLHLNISCPAPGDAAYVLNCVALAEVATGSSSRIQLPLTTKGDYSVTERSLSAVSWSSLFQPAYFRKVVKIIPKPTIMSVNGTENTGKCATYSKYAVLNQCGDGSEIDIFGHDFSDTLSVVVVPFDTVVTPMLEFPLDQVNRAAAFSVEVTGYSRSGGGSPITCQITEVVTGIDGRVRCTLTIPRDAVGLWQLHLTPAALPSNMAALNTNNDLTGLLTSGQLDSNAFFLDVDATPYVPIVEYSLQDCVQDMGAVWIGCVPSLTIKGVRAGATVAVMFWPVIDAQFFPEIIVGGNDVFGVVVGWTEALYPPGQREAVCANYTENDQMEASCVLDIPASQDGWSAVHVFVNGNPATRIPKAVLPRPRIFAVSGCEVNVLAECKNNTRLFLRGANFLIPGLAEQNPEVVFVLNGFGNAPAPPPTCVIDRTALTSQAIQCTLRVTEGTSGTFDMSVTVQAPNLILQSGSQSMTFFGAKPVIGSAVLDTCVSPETLQHCTDGVLRVEVVLPLLFDVAAMKVVFASPIIPEPLPVCTTLRQEAEGGANYLLCNMTFPEGGAGVYTLAIQHGGDVSEEYQYNMRGKALADIPLQGSVTFTPDASDAAAQQVSSVEVHVAHSFVLPPGYRLRSLYRVFPTAAEVDSVEVVAYDTYMTTFLANEVVVLTSLEGEGATTGVVRVELFYAKVSASRVHSMVYRLTESKSQALTALPMSEVQNYSIPEFCEVGDWSEWLPCSKPCNRGDTSRTRSVTNGVLPPWFNPADIGCPALEEAQTCNMHPCLCDPLDPSREQCNGAGLCNEFGVCDCRPGLEGAQCTQLSHGWRAKLLGALLIMVLVTGVTHSLASEHLSCIFIIVVECQILAGYLRTGCSPVDMSQAAADLEWIVHFPKPSAFGGEVGRLMWGMLLLLILLCLHMVLAAFYYRKALYKLHKKSRGDDTSAKLEAAKKRKRDAEKDQSKSKDGSNSADSEGSEVNAHIEAVVKEVEQKDKENESHSSTSSASSAEVPLTPVQKEAQLREQALRTGLAKVFYPSLSIFFWFLFLFPLVFTAVAAISEKQASHVAVGIIAIAVVAILPLVLLVFFFRRVVKLGKTAAGADTDDVDPSAINMRNTNSILCMKGFHSEVVYARCVTSNTLDQDNPGDVVKTSLFIAPIPRRFYSSKHTGDAQFKDRWGFAFTSCTAASMNFLLFYGLRVAVVAGILGVAPEVDNVERECPPLFATTIFVHILLLALMLFKVPWYTRFLTILMNVMCLLHILFGVLLVALSAVSFEDTSALSSTNQYLIVATLLWLVCMNLWGMSYHKLTRFDPFFHRNSCLVFVAFEP